MAFIKRFGFLALVNIGIIFMFTIIMQVLGIGHYITAYGINYSALIIMCLLWGMGGAFVSLFISKWMAKSIYGVQILSPSGNEGALVRKVHDMAKRAGLSTMPEVGIYNSPDLNAFATGPSRSNSLVAVSSGLINNMNEAELDGVLAHEVSHIANGDMVTMTLIQGVMNAFVMFFARIAAFALDQVMRDDEGRGGLGFIGRFMAIIFFQFVFGLMGTIIVSYFSRMREYKADSGSAKLVGNDKMIAALEALKRHYHIMEEVKQERPAIASMQISNKSAFLSLFSTHPDLDKRIAALR